MRRAHVACGVSSCRTHRCLATTGFRVQSLWFKSCAAADYRLAALFLVRVGPLMALSGHSDRVSNVRCWSESGHQAARLDRTMVQLQNPKATFAVGMGGHFQR
jgi:hypothetical protein